MWEAIETRGTRQGFKPGEALMHHGASGRTCYAMCSGTVLITATSSQGSTLVLGRRQRGALVGELAALEGAPRAATVTAKDHVMTVRLRPEDLHAILEDHPDLALSMLRNFAARIRMLSERFALRSEDLQSRILDVLETNHDETGDPVFRSTREELAGWVGATREAVVRSLQQLKADGRVELARGAVRLPAARV